MRKHFLLLLTLILSACTTTEFVVQPQRVADMDEKKRIVVFFDGTANDEASRTNIAKLHNIVTLQNRSDINAIYIKGVGTGGQSESKLLGMGLGAGIGRDVQQAYNFIASRYNPLSDDELYLFGFSRGAYTARILAGLIEVAGVPDLRSTNKKDREQIIEDIYLAHKGWKSRKEREADIAKVRPAQKSYPDIEFMGLWDTVEALGAPDFSEGWNRPGGRLDQRYFDQLCNIKDAAHALSIDDFRATSFTPTLLTYNDLTKECNSDVDIHSVVDEVWFAGAHSDVGGGYADTELDGVSLNWMLGKIRRYKLVPENTRVLENRFGLSHNADEGWLGIFYIKRNRHIPGYLKGAGYPGNKLPVHESVFERLGAGGPGKQWFEFDWSDERNYRHCFVSVDGTEPPDCFSTQCNLKLKDTQDCFKKVTTDYYTPVED